MVSDTQKDKRLTNFEINVLTYLTYKSNICTVKQLCAFWECDKSNMYKVLNKLKANHFIEATKEDEVKYYIIKENG